MRNKSIILAIFAIILSYTILNIIWLGEDSIPLWFDYGLYFDRSIQIFKSLDHGFIEFINCLMGLGKFADTSRPSRFILPLSSIPLYAIFGISEDVAVLTMMLFFAVMIFSINGISKLIFNSKVGLLSAIFVSLYPDVYWYSHHYSPDFAVMSFVSLSIYLLLATDTFRRMNYSLFFGISLGLGMVTKEIFAIFIIGPLSYIIFKFVRNFNFDKFRICRLRNLLFAFFACLIIASFWYLPHLNEICYQIKNTVSYNEEFRKLFGMPSVVSLQGLTFYLSRSLGAISVVNFSVFTLSLIILLFFRSCEGKSRDGFWILGFWFFIPYLILTTFPTKPDYYFLPVLPVFAVITSAGILRLKNKYFRNLIILFVVLIGISQILSVTIKNLNVNNLYQKKHVWMLPRKEDWKTKEIINYIGKTEYNYYMGKSAPLVAVIPNKHEISSEVFTYSANMLNLNLRFFGIVHNIPANKSYIIANADFIIFKSGGDQGLFITNQESDMIKECVIKSSLFIELPQKFDLPDGTSALIYMRKKK